MNRDQVIVYDIKQFIYFSLFLLFILFILFYFLVLFRCNFIFRLNEDICVIVLFYVLFFIY